MSDKPPKHGMNEDEMNEIRNDALEFAGIGMYRYKFDGAVVQIDRGAMKILGLEDHFENPDAIIGENVENLIIYTGPKHLLRDELRKHGHARNFIYPYKTLNGKEKWAVHDSYIIRDKESGEELIQGIIKDITQQMVIQNALKESEERFKRLVDRAQDIIIGWSIERKLEFVSPAVTSITGYTPEELLDNPGKGFELAAGKTPEVVDEYRAALESGSTLSSREFSFPHKDGGEVCLEARVTTVKNDKGEIIAFEGILRDITEKKISDQEILKAKQRSELYLDIMLHDITNYNQISLGNLDLLARKTELTEIQNKYIMTARRQLMRSENLIAKLRVIPELEKNNSGDIYDIGLDEIIRNCIGIVLNLYPDKTDSLLYESAGEVTVKGIELLEQAIFNVIENGVKHSPDGKQPKVRIEINPAGTDSNECVELRVVDNGPGIPEEMKEEIFNRSFRSKRKRGLGLGLFLAKDIIERSGGNIRVENTAGNDFTRGSVFIITLIRSHIEP